jgi:DNA-binding LacI/PurR family transcriptional regulator
VVMAIEERAYELGYDVVIAQTVNIPEREEACIRRLLSRRVDGMFIAPAYRMGTEARIYKELHARQVPTVLLGHSVPFCNQFVSVETDDVSASYNVTSHLLNIGHKRIAFFAGPPATPWTQERFEGYRRALRGSGLDVDEKLIFQAGRTVEDGAKAALQMINEGSDATAVQAVNDLVAVGCAEELIKQGLKIPLEMSVVGFGNIMLSEHFRVPLTTASQPKFRLGSAAVDSMLELLRGNRPESKRLPADLIVRSSSGIALALSPLTRLKTVNTDII